jgi:hypothetical protein
MVKRYEPNDNGPMRQFVGMDEHEFGDWVKFDDVETSLNIAQQLKDEISAMLNSWDSNHKIAFLDKFVLDHLPKLQKLSSI